MTARKESRIVSKFSVVFWHNRVSVYCETQQEESMYFLGVWILGSRISSLDRVSLKCLWRSRTLEEKFEKVELLTGQLRTYQEKVRLELEVWGSSESLG